MAGQELGPYKAIVRQNGEVRELFNAVEVIAEGDAKLLGAINLPSTVRAGREVSVDISVLKEGGGTRSESKAPILVLDSDQPDALFRANPRKPWSRSLLINGGSDADPSQLRLGEWFRTTVQMKAPNRDAKVKLRLTWVKRIKQDAFANGWSALSGAVKPDWIDDEPWGHIWKNFTSQLGSDSDTFLDALRSSASWLSSKGAPSRDGSDLLTLPLATASGDIAPIGTLESSTDLQVAAPGMGLTFARFAPKTVDGRMKSGVLGRGWRHSYDLQLRQGRHDRMELHLPDGGIRYFTAARGDKWIEEAGGHGQLSVGNNGKTLTEKSGIKIDFNIEGRPFKIRDTNANSVDIGYLSGTSDKVASVRHSNGASMTFQYNALQTRLTGVSDSLGRSVGFTFRGRGGDEYLEKVSLVGGRSVTYENIESDGSPNAHALSRITYSDGTSRLLDYLPDGRVNSIALAGGLQKLTMKYGNLGEVGIQDALGNLETAVRGVHGKPIGSTTAGGRGSLSKYDQDNNLVSLNWGGSGRSQSKQWSGTYDARGNLVGAVDAGGVGRDLGFGQNDSRLTWLKDGRGHLTTYERDAKGNVTKIIYPDFSVETFSYDDKGLLLLHVNRRGHQIAYTYDPDGRVWSITLPDRTLIYAYDAKGRMTEAQCSVTGTIKYFYDDRDFLRRTESPGNRWVEHDYDDGGKRTALRTSDGQHLLYSYDQTGALQEIKTGGGDLVVRYGYDDGGRLLLETKGNGTSSEYSYDAEGKTTAIIHRKGQTVQSEYRYTYDGFGNPVEQTTPLGKWKYGYDVANQLTSVIRPDGHQTLYEYDAEGNRTRVVENGVATEYTTNILNQYTGVGGRQYAYDADGNIISWSDGSESTSFTYDSLNRVRRISGPEGTIEFEYDAVGNRTRIVKDGVATDLLIDGNGSNVLAELDAEGNLVARYSHGYGLVAKQTASDAYFYGFDATGNTRQLTDAEGNVVNWYEYEPFGRVLGSEQNANNWAQFVGKGQVRALTPGLAIMGSRLYLNDVGRYSASDPVAPLGLGSRVYSYAINAPLRFVDSSGLFPRNPSDAFFNPPPSDWRDPRIPSEVRERYYADQRQRADATAEHFKNIVSGGFKKLLGVLKKRPRYESIKDAGIPYIEELAEVGLMWWDLADSDPGRTRNIFNLKDASEMFRELFQEILDQYIEEAETVAEQDTESQTSSDPNEKVGIKGIGDAGWVDGKEPFTYTIYFENLPTAKAHAQEVFISDVLSKDLDFSTMELREINIAGQIINEFQGYQSGRFVVPLNNTNLVADIEASFDIATGALKWTMRSIDPLTGDLPPETDKGLLAPNDATGRGEGHVTFSIRPKWALPDGREVTNQARIIFDTNPPIDTNVWKNRLDLRPPVSRVRPHTGILLGANSALVEWSGGDGAGSGIASYDVYVSTDGGSWQKWLHATDQSRALFAGERGKTYRFFSIATDRVGYREAEKSDGEATVKFPS